MYNFIYIQSFVTRLDQIAIFESNVFANSVAFIKSVLIKPDSECVLANVPSESHSVFPAFLAEIQVIEERH